MGELANGNHNVSTKELVLGLDEKLDKYMEAHTKSHDELLEGMRQLKHTLELHAADNHPAAVRKIQDEKLREEGRRDVLRYFLGASALGFATGLVSLILGLMRLFGGDGA